MDNINNLLPIMGVIIGCLATVYLLSYALLVYTQDAKEPPVLGASIPFLGSLIGMLTEKSRFYARLRDQVNQPIYTLRLPFTRVYVINATELIPPLEKLWRTVSLIPIIAASGPGPMGMSKEAKRILHKDITSDSNPVVGFIRVIAPFLSPGAALDTMNRRAVEVISDSVYELEVQAMESLQTVEKKGHREVKAGGNIIDLWAWTHHVMLMATTEAIYGPGNPYRDHAIEKAWERFEPAYLSFSLAPFKSFLAPTAFRDRELLAAAWKNYLNEGWHEQASEFIKSTYSHNKKHGLNDDDIARAEIGHSFATIGTTAPATSWLLFHIFSDSTVLAEVRKELEPLVERDDSSVRKIHMTDIRTRCPILLSTYKEMLRYRGLGNSVRVCLEDTMLDGRFLLKKSSIVIVPQVVQHTSQSVWGEDVNDFDHLRFAEGLKGPSGVRKGAKRTAFRAFGGGHTLCPGRHFSTTEIMAITALMVLRFDIVPVGEDSTGLNAAKWAEPTWECSPMISSFPLPDEDIRVRVEPRDNGKWAVVMDDDNGSSEGMDIAEQNGEN